MKNLMETVNEVREQINSEFDLSVETMNEIRNTYKDDIFNLIVCAFSFGYLQGGKATKAELRKEIMG